METKNRYGRRSELMVLPVVHAGEAEGPCALVYLVSVAEHKAWLAGQVHSASAPNGSGWRDP